MKQPLTIHPYLSMIALVCISFLNASAQTDDPFIIKDGLYDQSETDSLGLFMAEGTETVTIFAPTEETDKFSNGAVLMSFKGWLYCQWQSAANDEDAADTWVAYSRSQDGITWSEPMVLAESLEDGYCSSGGWWATDDTLVAYINTWPGSVDPRGGYTRYRTSTDGENWSEIKPLPMVSGDSLSGIFEQDPHALPDGRIINAAHFQTGLIINPVYTDDPTGIRGWTKAEFTTLPSSSSISREIEPSWFLKEDGTAVMIFRDQNSSFKKLASVSTDRGETWTKAVLTDMPDSRSKQSAGNLPDGTAFMVSNPVNNKLRIPLVVTLSKDGYLFNQAYVLRKGGDGIQDLRTEGKAKRSGYHYPKSYIWNDYLYVSYATNKEDVELTRVPVSNLKFVETGIIQAQAFIDVVISVNTNRELYIKTTAENYKGTVKIYNLNGKLINSMKLLNGESRLDMSSYTKGIYIARISNNKGSTAKRFIVW